MIDNLSDRFTEVYSILKCLDKEYQEMIPLAVWDDIKSRMNFSYKYSYVPGDEQHLDDYTIALLNQIYFDYLKFKNNRVDLTKFNKK